MKRRPRHVPTKAELLARMPRGMRPKLRRDQVTDLGLVHNANLDAIARGEASATIMWHFAEAVFLWSKVADTLDRGVDEMRAQLELATRLVERFARTGKVAFTGPDYQLAKQGVMVMDALAEIVDQPTASAAADWSQAQMDALQTKAGREDAPMELIGGGAVDLRAAWVMPTIDHMPTA